MDVKVPPRITDRVVNFTSDADALAGPRPSGALYGATFTSATLTSATSPSKNRRHLPRIGSLDGADYPSQTQS